MPPSSSSRGAGASAMVSSIMTSAANKESLYREGVSSNHGHTIMAAKHLDQLEKLLESMPESIIGQKDAQEFLDTQRERLKKIAKMNAENELNVQAYVGAVKQLKQEELRNDHSDATNTTTTKDDYLPICRDYMKKQRETLGSADEHKYMREVLVELKEEKAKVGDDDDIEVVDTGAGGSTQTLKCPLTTSLLEEPYKNTKCGHVYSKLAILDYIKQQRANRRQCKCPTAGCSNTNLTEEQLVKDDMTSIALNRERRRMDKMQQDRASQASQIDSDDDE